MSPWEMQTADGTKVVVAAQRDHAVTVTLSLTRGSATMTVGLTDEEAMNLGNNLGHVVRQA
jgi:hypothetical protein